MSDNGERIFLALMERAPIERLEEDNVPLKEKGFHWENNKYRLANLVNDLLAQGSEA